MKRRKMYTGKEGTLISQAEFESLVKTYQDLYGKDESYVKSSSVSFSSISAAMVPGAVAFRIYNGSDGIRTRHLLVPVDANGKELPIAVVGEELEKESGVQKKALRDDPPHCPPQC